MLAQYVFTAANAVFRIVRHGHRWRALRDTTEIGRFDTAEAAALSLRDAWRDARLPRRLTDWRFLPPAALGHIAPPSAAVLARLAAA
ncbi:hypothetical protein [Luteibacter sp. 22Crub2.1]|uniref:hypothetical protein n=1 Tax=Luteibacter sp. 22Crub2.1 TaxID=1283288 RepID=UPI0009A67E70|nr:hypothetical protein [Luteibacter sp. 22Crub2.1]SKB82916.1 hypothetical protein SAMN05660880_02819 [Luteibacter sp. 22Crub2.1]